MEGTKFGARYGVIITLIYPIERLRQSFAEVYHGEAVSVSDVGLRHRCLWITRLESRSTTKWKSIMPTCVHVNVWGVACGWIDR